MTPGSNPPPSVPPTITWPMVAYAFVKELPYTLMVAAGGVVAVTFVVRSPNSSLEPLAAVIGPAIVSALGRSRPADSILAAGGAGMLAFLFRKLTGT